MKMTLRTLDRCGNALCLDFVNTVHLRPDPGSRDYLGSLQDLLQWARDGQSLSTDRHRRLCAAAAADPRRAARAFQQAIALREAIYRIFTAFSDGRPPGAADMARLNETLQRALAHRRVALHRGRYEWESSAPDGALDSVLWPIAMSAADLLTGADRARVRACPPPEGCGWLYLDTSKNGLRRWCSMRTCGGQAKARRYYRRQRGK